MASRPAVWFSIGSAASVGQTWRARVGHSRARSGGVELCRLFGGDHDGGGHDVVVDCRMVAVALVKQAYYYGACKQKQPVNSEWDGMEWKGGDAYDCMR